MLENFDQLPVMALGAITFAVLFASADGGFLTGRLSPVKDGKELSRRFPAMTFLVQAFGFSAVVMLILDFDNTADGLIRIDGWVMQSAVVEMDRILDGG